MGAKESKAENKACLCWTTDSAVFKREFENQLHWSYSHLVWSAWSDTRCPKYPAEVRQISRIIANQHAVSGGATLIEGALMNMGQPCDCGPVPKWLEDMRKSPPSKN